MEKTNNPFVETLYKGPKVHILTEKIGFTTQSKSVTS